MFRQITDWELQNLSNAELVMLHNQIEIERAYAARVRKEIDERLVNQRDRWGHLAGTVHQGMDLARQIVAEVLGGEK